ncbi:PP2C family protein-serine/threonine phosphatase [Cellulomonas composti]|nr:protein phosphatase 2C domain-containing protein [Cellulomonas composti]
MSAVLPGLRFGVASAAGPRETNEDATLAQDDVFLVADGMGGHDAGEVASATAVDALRALADDATAAAQAGAPSGVSEQDVRAAVAAAHDSVRALADSGHRRPGTTLAGVVVTRRAGAPCWLVVNVGDSRTYRMAGAVLEQVSRDHSEVAELVADGLLPPDEAARHPWRHVVTRVLGGGASSVEPDVFLLPVSPGDRMLVCSDGLTDALPDARVEAELKALDDPQAAADRLVAAALAAGARDNVTVIVVDAPAHLPG